jgi:hypothetical protein
MLDLPPGLDLTPLESSSARAESGSPRAEARPKSTEETPPVAPASAAAAPSPTESPAQGEAVATRGAWSKVLDDQGTASGW